MKKDQQNPIGLSIIYIGSVVPDEPNYWNYAFSRAGNMAQEGLIQAFARIDPYISILSFPPLPAFPKGHRMVSRAGWAQVEGHKYIFIPFINLPFIKYFNIGIEILGNTLQSIRSAPHRDVYLVSYNFNTFISLPLTIARLAGWVLGKRVRLVPVLFDVDVPGHTVPDNILRRIDDRVFRYLVRHVDGALAVSQAITTDVIAGTPALVVEGGVKNQTIERFYGLERNDQLGFHVLLAGALERYNGVDILLEAMRLINDPEVRLVIAGKGSLSAQVEEAAKNDRRIQYVGYVSHDELSALYNKADVLINHRSHQRINSKYVFPSKLLEYLLTGIPTISTRFASLPSEYGEHLYLVEGESAQELADAISQIKLSGRGRNMAAADFIRREKSWESWSSKIGQFLRSL